MNVRFLISSTNSLKLPSSLPPSHSLGEGRKQIVDMYYTTWESVIPRGDVGAGWVGRALACEVGNFPTVSLFLLHAAQIEGKEGRKGYGAESALRVVAITRVAGQFLPHRASAIVANIRTCFRFPSCYI